MPEDTDPTGTPAMTDAASDTSAADVALALRENAILKAGLDLDSPTGAYLLANPTADVAALVALTAPVTPVATATPAQVTPSPAQIAQLQAAQVAQLGDANAQAATDARQLLVNGAVGDVGPPDVHPMDLARRAIHDGLTKQHLSHGQAVAAGVGQIMAAAARGDQRVFYTGRTDPGA